MRYTLLQNVLSLAHVIFFLSPKEEGVGVSQQMPVPSPLPVSAGSTNSSIHSYVLANHHNRGDDAKAFVLYYPSAPPSNKDVKERHALYDVPIS